MLSLAAPPVSAIFNAAPKPISRKYDQIFYKYGHGLPVPFLRALGKRESNLNPRESKASYWGLLQVGWKPGSVLPGYNERHRTSYTKDDLLDPVVNTTIATDLLRRIIQSYARNHPNVANMQENWRNPEFVRLLVAGWNSGYSEAAGVGHVADYLERKGIPVTHANVFKYAAEAGGTKHLSNPKKESWQRGVVDLFYAQPDALTPFLAMADIMSPLQFVLPHTTLQGLPVAPGGLSPAGLGAVSLQGRNRIWKWGLIAGALAGLVTISYAIARPARSR